MFHTGDEFEIRARAARNKELRSISRALTGFLFRLRSSQPPTSASRFKSGVCANDLAQTKSRAA